MIFMNPSQLIAACTARAERMVGLLSVLAVLQLLGTGPASAFPPAPYYSLYGMVRDQVGQTVTAEGAEVILLKGGVEVGRTPITSMRLDQSYELNIRLDHARSGTTFYTNKAVATGGLFSIVVSMNGELFYPIEVSGNLTAGKGGERVKLDLTLGEDKDKDGLPDTWEAWQLYQAGLYPDENGNWDLSLRFEYYAITGKVYTIESSLDMQTWTRVEFAVGAPGTGNNAHQATDVGIVSAYAAPRATTKEFYRLSVR